MSEAAERLHPSLHPNGGRMIEIDSALFSTKFNKRHFLLRHQLSDHELFQLPRLLELARNTAATRPDDLYYDAGVRDIGQRWGTAPPQFPVDETIEKIENAGAWIVLKRADTDPAYAAVLDRCMSDILEVGGHQLERKMRRKEVIVFITSPGRLTTYHIDSETNFLLQVHGVKEISVFPPDDRDVTTEEEIERFYTTDTNAAIYKPHLQDRADAVTLEPGTGIHIPVHAAHWLRNGDNISISVSINYHSYDHERASLYFVNHYLRKVGLKPTPPFQYPMLDAVKRPIGVAGSRLLNSLRPPIRKQ